MKILLAQLNPTVGDVAGNAEKAKKILDQGNQQNADIVVFSELFLCGYPPKDLLEKKWFIDKVDFHFKEILNYSKKYPGQGFIMGLPQSRNQKLYNTAVLAEKGEVIFSQAKSLLPNYDVFDEKRYFTPAEKVSSVLYKHKLIGMSICEDAWGGTGYPNDKLKDLGVRLIINISASPFNLGKITQRRKIFSEIAGFTGADIVYVNQVGGNDDLVFDGTSFYLHSSGKFKTVLSSFREQVMMIDSDSPREDSYPELNKTESAYQALVLGIKDYMGKCGFGKAVVGLSGGIDSAVTCVLAVDAVGADNVLGIGMPSPFSSDHSISDSKILAENLKIDFKLIRINSVYQSYLDLLAPWFENKPVDVTEENIQARIRGNILMAFSNKYGYLVLSTGNKSELSVGYCTLYGDMSGGLAVLSDVPKTMVYDLAEYVNLKKERIPLNIITKPPSAELKPNQLDQDTLPPYSLLDEILYLYVEKQESIDHIVEKGLDRATVKRVVEMVNHNEYKRKQAAPGIKITSKAFGSGWRMPLAAKF
ncbi:MAG: NAD+ synthase [bacterium]